MSYKIQGYLTNDETEFHLWSKAADSIADRFVVFENGSYCEDYATKAEATSVVDQLKAEDRREKRRRAL